MFFKQKILILLTLFYCAQVNGQIKPPNYDFSLDSFNVFFPDSNLEQAVALHGEYQEMEKKENTRLLRFNVKHLRYQFPVFVQVDDKNNFLEFFARLPSYFLHDLFHQSLINRFQKQDHYLHKNGTSIYKWNNKKEMNLTYSATCTITCFPIFLSAVKMNLPENYEAISKEMRASQAR